MTRSALFLKYRYLAPVAAKGFFLPGSSEDDVLQEAMIGLWVATGKWDPERGQFKPYAYAAMRSHLVSCLRGATRLKQTFLNDSLRQVSVEGRMIDATDMIADTRSEPFRKLEGMEMLRRLASVPLTPIERQVLLSVLQGVTYDELCAETHRSWRSIENAFQRAKKKVLNDS